MNSNKNIYPVEYALPDLKRALSFSNSCVLAAPPGAGKTTIVPPSLLNEQWLKGGKIMMLEPRRLAARRSAEYIASLMGEKCGETVGYRIRAEALVSDRTRIEVVTEGILTLMLQADQELPGVGLIIFDEFHERSIHADTALAFALDVQTLLRPDLKILVMSATIDSSQISRLLGGAPVIESSGIMYPVETRYLKQRPEGRLEAYASEAVIKASRAEDGDILLFLPGRREIMRTARILEDRLPASEFSISRLYGEAPRQEQDAALLPDARGRRKIILSTSLAETSLTINGIRTVIDSGLSRMSAFDIRRGMSGLITVPVSKASADQRRGRAGREQPGTCYRLWTEQEHELLQDFTKPEILSADLASLALELARWGTPGAEGLRFIDRPPDINLKQGRSVLSMLGVLDANGRLTGHGRLVQNLPLHPRLGSMILKGKGMNLGASACMVAAILEEKDILGSKYDIDLNERLHAMESCYHNQGGMIRISSESRRLARIAGIDDKGIMESGNAGLLLAMAYPDRIAVRKQGRQYQMAVGTTALLPEHSLLSREQFIAIGDVDGAGSSVKIFMAAPVSKEDILSVFKEELTEEETVLWDQGCVRGKRLTKLGAINIDEKAFRPEASAAELCVLNMIREKGISVLPWDERSMQIRDRISWCRLNSVGGDNWPQTDDCSLLNSLEEWLLPFLSGVRRQQELNSLDMNDILESAFAYDELAMLNRLAPSHLQMPGGSIIRLKYNGADTPVLAVRLQELFGQTDTPRIGGGRIPVLIHLLSPAKRPLAITQDLASFWKNTYPELLRGMRAKYPKHVWPDDPLTAIPTNKTKAQLRRRS